jgi:phage-related minor tail protein
MSLDVGKLVGFLELEADGFHEGLAGALDSMKESGGKLVKLAAGIGAAAAIALGAALAGAIQQQDVGATIAAKLGQTTEAAARYGKLAGKIYAANFGASLDEIGEAIATIQQSRLLPEDATESALEGITEKALTIVDLFGLDLPATINAVKQLLRTGLVSSADEAFDIITKGEQKGIDKAGDLLDTLNEYPVQFKKLGLSGVQALGLLRQGLQGGARDSDVVADALKEFAIRAVDGSSSTAQGFKLLGLNGKQMSEQIAKGGAGATAGLQTVLDKLRNIKDPALQAQAATALFGTQAEDLGQALFALDPSTAVQGMGKVAGATDAAGKVLSDTASSNLEQFKRQAQQTFVDVLGGEVLPVVTDAAKKLNEEFGPAVRAVSKWMGQHKEIVIPLAGALATFVGVILAIAAALKVWAVIQAVLDAELWANPIGAIILAVILLIAVIVLIVQHLDWFKNAWHVTWEAIKDAAAATWHWVEDKAKAFVDFFKSIPGKLAAAGKGLFMWVVDAYRSAINWVIDKWNGLHFKIPGISVPGVGEVWGGIDLHVPQIPQLKDGGIVQATPGGRRVNVAEGGEDEVIAPLSKLRALLGAGRRGAALVLQVDGDPAMRALFAAMRGHVQAYYGGSVDDALAGSDI